MTKVLHTLTIAILITLSSIAQAQSVRALPVKSSFQAIIPVEDGFLVDLSIFPTTSPLVVLTPSQIEDYIPTNIEDGSSGNTVVRKILDRSLRTVMKNPTFRNSKLVQTARVFAEQVETNIAFATGNKSTNQVKHRVRFKVLAFESKAEIKYSGYFNANLVYDIGHQAAALEFVKNLTDNSSLSMNVSHNHEDSIGFFKFQLNY